MKTQAFANSELEIVAERRPKKEPAPANYRPRNQTQKYVTSLKVLFKSKETQRTLDFGGKPRFNGHFF